MTATQAEAKTESKTEIFIKAIPLKGFEYVDIIKSEVKSGNIVITNVSPLAKKNIDDVKRAINELNEYATLIEGDIARLGEERVIITPKSVRIWRGQTPR
ncbi:cell division protein SepF [Candidatus Bathyarchaeota archaeon]|nr:cell division protein SepF [Candidatus Bathyarchaeota archaeon]MBS7630733.1 cell division protein SepF [Candidatus Bathyarchaeota archaeon]